MRSDEYHRLGAACAGMAKSTHSDDKSRWPKLARECSTLANETAEKRTTPRLNAVPVVTHAHNIRP